MSALLALFFCTLRQDVRSRAANSARGWYLSVIITGVVAVGLGIRPPGVPGLLIFRILIWMNLLIIAAASVSYFASSVAEEKEGHTLGLLRMTNLNSLSILLGKSTSRLVGALLLLASGFPFATLAISLGGVSLLQIEAAYVTLGAWLFFAANLGLLASVVCPRVSVAALFACLVQAAAVLCLAAITNAWISPSRWIWLEADMGAIKQMAWYGWKALPGTQLIAIERTGFAGPIAGQPAMLLVAAGGVCFLLAWLLFEPCCVRARSSASTTPSRPPGRARHGLGRPWRRPLMWKEFHFARDRSWAKRVAWVMTSLWVGWVLFILPWPERVTLAAAGPAVFMAGMVLWSYDLLLAAGRVFHAEWRDRTLSALSLLPMSPGWVAYQKVAGALLATWPGLSMAMIGFAMGRVAGGSFSTLDAGAIARIASLGASVLLLLHLTAWLSLLLRYGAIPAAILITVLFLQITSTVVTLCVFSVLPRTQFSPNTDLAFIVPNATNAALCLGLTLFLHPRIVPRLERLAAEEM